jgi:hypothetical protein
MLRFINKLMAPDQYHHLVQKLNNFNAMFPSTGVSVSVLAVMATGTVATLVQATTPAADISWVEHLTLEGALVVAVGVLWRALSTERAQNIKSTEAVTAALVSSTASSAELRASNAELRATIEHLRELVSDARR